MNHQRYKTVPLDYLFSKHVLMKRVVIHFAFFLVCALSCHRAHVTGVTPGYAVMNDTVAQQDSAIAAILRPYKIQLDSVMNEVVGTTTLALPNEKGKQETLLGNFVADVC